jgi:hypothetical protein
MKLCFQCTYCAIYPEEPGYSEYTPGSPPSINCNKGHWREGQFFLGTEEAFKLMCSAENCKDFCPAKWAKKSR